MTIETVISRGEPQPKNDGLRIPLDDIIRTQDGRYLANIAGTPRKVAYLSDLDCWFTLQETPLGAHLDSPVWRIAAGQWQQGTLATLRDNPRLQATTWQDIQLPPVPIIAATARPIPEIIHYIWIGDNPIPADLQTRMLASARRCPSYRFVLHAYPHSKKGWRRLKNQFPAYGRIVLNNLHQDASMASFLTTALGRYFQRFLQMSTLNYGAASDILRIVLLHRHGGIYMDVDDEITVQVKPGHRLQADHADILLSQIVRVDMYHFHGYGNSVFACHAGNPLLATMMQEMLARLTQADGFFMQPRPWYESDTMANEEKKQRMLTYLQAIFFLTGPVLFSDVLEKHASAIFSIERHLLQAYETLNVLPTEPRIIADDYMEAFHAAKTRYQPFSDPSFNVRIGTAHTWNPRPETT